MTTVLAQILLRPNGDRRVVSAVLSFATAAYAAAIALALQVPKASLLEMLLWSVFYFWFTGLFAIGIGGALFILLLRTGSVQFWSSVVGGSIVGVIASGFLPKAAFQSAGMFGAVGGVSGAVFFGVLLGTSKLLRVQNPLTVRRGL